MGTNNLLNTSTNFIDFAVDKIGIIDLNFIGKIIQWLIEGVGIIGLGVVLFTLILKTIVLPLDVYSRVKSKQQSLLMKKMRPQMEKLQKQYANDSKMYNQKVAELQKQSGYSLFSACIPMLVSLVIFMVVFSSFSTYSQYANLTTYNNMVDAYNTSVEEYVYSDTNTTGFLIEDEDSSLGTVAYRVDFDKFVEVYNGSESLANFSSSSEAEKIAIVRQYVRDNARTAAADYYKTQRTTYGGVKFLWIGNIWYPDSMFNKEVPSFSKFSSSISRAVGETLDSSYEESYNEVTYNLTSEKSTYNGYFVLIVLAIGLMMLQQFIMMRSQKDANELSSVDGSAATTNKWMMIMMPIMYGFFSFLYSAAFSIYMITNTCYSLITTLIINKAMDVSFAKREGNETVQTKAKRVTNNRKRLK
jgi:YidC/Oxa1 family membrane protein insertase